jgi:carboxypeptidase family protein
MLTNLGFTTTRCSKPLVLKWMIMFCLSIALSNFASAQGIRGTIKGTVTDANGAVVTGATVALMDVAKQATIRTVKTDGGGVYQLVEVEPSIYQITISATGFSDNRMTDIKVEPNRNLVIDVSLSVSGATEQVTVTASQELIDRESATLGTTVDSRRVVDLPLNGRGVLQLAQLQPGVIPVTGGLGIRVNGGRTVENNVQLDGSNNNEVAVGGSVGVQPRPDAVQEFRVLTSNFDPEFGRNTGSIINVVVRSGENSLHGNARVFYRPTFLSAARFFDQSLPGATPLRGTNDFRRQFERKEFGGNLGGPIYIPKLYNGKNRAFFFIDYEGRRQLIGDSRVLTGVPTAEQRTGNFSNLGRQIFDPSTSQQFPGNIIPDGRISPIAKYYLQFLPIPDASGRARVVGNEITNSDQLTTRLDFQINQKQSLSGTYTYFDQLVDSPFAFGGASVPGFGSFDLRTTQNYTVRHTYTLSPNIVNSLLVGYARNDQPSTTPQNTTTPAQIGFTANFVADPSFVGPPRITLNNRNIILGNTIQGPQARVSENFQIQDSVTWVSGDHRFKFGFDGTKYRQDQAFLFVNQGIINFSRTAGTKTTGDDFTDFLLGVYPTSMQFGSDGLRDFRQDFIAGFAQDTWRARENFTLTYGVRYEYVSPLTDKFDRVAYYRPGATSQLLTSGQLQTLEGVPFVVPPGTRAPNGLVYVGDPDPVLGGTVPRGGVAKDMNNFGPRLGIAYSPKLNNGFLGKLGGGNQTVIRAGFGIFYGAAIADTILQQLSAPGFNGTAGFFQPGGGTLANPFAGDPFPSFQSTRPAPRARQNLFESNAFNVIAPLSQFSRATDPNIRTPYTMQYNLTIERGFAKDYVATLSYIGNRGVKLFALEQVNYAVGTFFPAQPGRTIPTPAQGNANLRRFNDDIQGGISQMVSAGNSHYHSFQAQLQKRFSRGLLFQAGYTYSKLITDSDELRSNLDLLDRSITRGFSPDDVPHRFVGSFIYDLPFGKRGGRMVRTLLGGYGFGGIVTFQSGTPFNVNNPFDTVGTGGGVTSFADLGASFQPVDPRENDSRAFNADAFRSFGDPNAGFVLARDFRRGTAGNNQFRLQNGLNNWDLIVTKKTQLSGERANLELRFEAFNAFNHTQFNNADTNLLNTATFGKFTSAREARILQLGARISF